MAREESFHRENDQCTITLKHMVDDHYQMFVSLDGEISWNFVGYVQDGCKFVGVAQFHALDTTDQEAVKQAVADNWPDYSQSIVKPLTPEQKAIQQSYE